VNGEPFENVGPDPKSLKRSVLAPILSG